MPLEELVPGSPADWLRHARSDLALASIPLPADSLYSDLCFHAQQTVEKSLKAILVHLGIEFRKVHHIGYLLTLLPDEIKASVPVAATELSEITSYAVMFLYPGGYEDVSESEYRLVIMQARKILDWADNSIREDRKT